MKTQFSGQNMTKRAMIEKNATWQKAKLLNRIKLRKSTKKMCEMILMKQLKEKLLSFVDMYF